MLLYVAAVAYLCFANFSDVSNISRTIFGIETDKLVHFCMFLPFPILAFFSIGKYPKKVWKNIFLAFCILLAGCMFAAATEVIQSRIIYRTGDPRDFKADLIAMAISTTVLFITIRTKTRRSKA